MVGRLRLGLLGRHVLWSAQDFAHPGHLLCRVALEQFRKAKIGDVDVIGGVNQHVARLQVAVYHAFAVRSVERSGKLLSDVHYALDWQPAGFGQEIV